jgi:S-adenosyl-L-methionine hydrolase (adenosine-forming)
MPIALLTDFGTRDYFVAAMKGTILSINPSAVIVDITHEIPPHDIREASFTLRACYRDFPPGTIFLAVVDPGVGSERRAIAAEAGGFYFVAPDNGLLGFIFGDESTQVYEITETRLFRSSVSSTFHGRDVFAPVAAHLSSGVKPEELGRGISDPVSFGEPEPRLFEGGIEGEVIHIDRFGNLVTNITPGDLPASYNVEINGRIIEKQVDHYAGAREGEMFSITGSAGFLEISVREGSAANALDAQPGLKVIVRHR